jgi:hypothetical protein
MLQGWGQGSGVLYGWDRGRQTVVAPMAGGGGTIVSRATEEREHLAVLKNC